MDHFAYVQKYTLACREGDIIKPISVGIESYKKKTQALSSDAPVVHVWRVFYVNKPVAPRFIIYMDTNEMIEYTVSLGLTHYLKM